MRRHWRSFSEKERCKYDYRMQNTAQYTAPVVCAAATFAAVQEGHYIKNGKGYNIAETIKRCAILYRNLYACPFDLKYEIPIPLTWFWLNDIINYLLSC